MKKNIITLFIIIASLISCPLFADEGGDGDSTESSPFNQKEGPNIEVGAGFNLLQSANTYSNQPTFLALLRGEFFIKPSVGGFIGLDWTKRGFYSNTFGVGISSSYLDIPFGFIFKTGSFLSSFASVRSHFLIGGYYALPLQGAYGTDSLGNFQTALGSLTTNSFFGVYLSQESIFEVSSGFGLGYNFWFKFPLGTALKNPSGYSVQYFYELGVSLILSYM